MGYKFELYGLYCPYTDNIKYVGITKPKSNIYGLNVGEISRYLSNGLNYVEIGKKFGCSNKIIYKFIKKHNLYAK